MNTIQISNERVPRRIRNMVLLGITAGGVLVAGQVRGQVTPPPTITVNDLEDGNPLVTLPSSLSTLPVTTGFEEASVTLSRSLFPTLGTTPSGVSVSLLLTEPAGDTLGPRVSDYITATAISADLVTLFFASDGAADYTKNFPTSGPNSIVTSVEESGLPQIFLNEPNLQVAVISDVSGTEVPDAMSTLGCLGLALTALAGFRRAGLIRIRS